MPRSRPAALDRRTTANIAGDASGRITTESLVTTSHLVQHQSRVQDRFDGDTSLLSALDELDNGLIDVLETTAFAPLLSGSAYVARARHEAFLSNFVEWYVRKQSHRLPAGTTVNDCLSKPPLCELANDNAFWRSIVFVLAKRQAIYRNVNANRAGATQRTFVTNRSNFIGLQAAYRRFTDMSINNDVFVGCLGVLETYSTNTVRAKPIASWENIKSIIRDGLYTLDTLRCARERIQVTLFILLMLTTGARPSEITLGRNLVDALKWKDITFYVSEDEGEGEDGGEGEGEDGGEDGGEGENGGSIGREDDSELVGGATRVSRTTRATQSRKPLRLGCDITFRNLKGLRTDPSAFRTQPLYSSSHLAPCEDVVLLLATLAKEDGKLADGLDFDEIMDSVDRRVFQGGRFFELPINEEINDTFVFRKVIQKSEGRQCWTVSDTEGMMTEAVTYQATKAAVKAGFVDFTPYSIRRLTSNKVNSTKLTDETRKAVVGHRLGSSTFFRAYMSRRTAFDLLGLVTNGKENDAMMEAHGLRSLVTAQLNHDDLATIELKEDVIKLRHIFKESRQVCKEETKKAPLPLTQDDAERLAGLRAAIVIASSRLYSTRQFHRQELEETLRLRLEKETNVAACRGDRKKARAVLAADLQDDTDVDGTVSMITGQDGLGAEEDAEAEHFAEEILAATAAAAPPIDTSSTIKNQEAVNRLEERLSALALEHSSEMIGRRKFNKSLLFDGKINDGDIVNRRSGADIKTTMDALLDNAGTVTGWIQDVNSIGSCPSCETSFEDLSAQRRQYPTEAFVDSHMAVCKQMLARQDYIKACVDALSDQPCPYDTCQDASFTFDSSDATIESHCKSHWINIRARSTDGTLRCLLTDDNGQQCTFNSAENSKDLLAYHMEADHGFPHLTSDTINCCRWHRNWQFGLVQMENHNAEHVEEMLRLGSLGQLRDGELLKWIRHMCPYCLKDETVSMTERGRLYYNSANLDIHILRHHIYTNRELATTCPLCDQEIQAWEVPQHFQAVHAWHFGARDREIGHNFDLLPTRHDESYERRRLEWIDWVTEALNAFNAEQNRVRVAITDAEETMPCEEEGDGDIEGPSIDELAVINDAVRQAGQAATTRPAAASAASIGRRQCSFCLANGKAQVKYEHTLPLAMHIASKHIFDNRESHPTCPDCNIRVPARQFVAHLEDDHAYFLSGKVNVKAGSQLSDLCIHPNVNGGTC